MSPLLRNILAAIAGIIVGGFVNMGIVALSSSLIPLPEGVDPKSVESMRANIHLLRAEHFIMPFLAHALGTLAGAFVAAKIAATDKMKFAIGLGVFYLLGGIVAAFVIPAPTWFIALDVIVAYIPMAWLGGKLGSR